MRKNRFYNKILPYYEKAVDMFLEIISNYNVELYSINEYETVIEIEKTTIYYLGLNELYDTQEKEDFMYDFFNKDISNLFTVVIVELTENSLFQFNMTKFRRDYEDKYGVNSYYFFSIKKFEGYYNLCDEFREGSFLWYIDKNLPKLSLRTKYEQWSGWIYHYILFEISYEDKKEFCLWYTVKNDLITTIRKKFSDLKMFILSRKDEKTYLNHMRNGSDYGIISKNRFTDFIISLNLKKYKDQYENFLRDNIKYTIVDKGIKNINEVEVNARQVLGNAYLNYYDNYEKGTLLLPPAKWKSEYLVKELCERLYGANNVIYQYRPFFLQTNKGQLSYDVFLIKQKIAIEYQGKQHFEPVNFFGGQQNFEKQVERDKLKMKLSKENGIKLVYIYYNETISEELIKSRIG